MILGILLTPSVSKISKENNADYQGIRDIFRNMENHGIFVVENDDPAELKKIYGFKDPMVSNEMDTFLASFINNRKKFFAALPGKKISATQISELEKIKHITEIMNPDVIVCASENEKNELSKKIKNHEVVLLKDFAKSKAYQALCRGSLSPKNDFNFSDSNLSEQDRLDATSNIIGKILRYTRSLKIADPYLYYTQNKKKKAVIFFIKQWEKASPYGELTIEIYTTKDDSSNHASQSANKQKDNLLDDLKELKKQENISDEKNITFDIKIKIKDKEFQDRYIQSCMRHYKLGHDLEDFASYTPRGSITYTTDDTKFKTIRNLPPQSL